MANRELVHDPDGFACNMEWIVRENGETVYRGPEWAARLRVECPQVMTERRREEMHCPKCDSADLFESVITEGGFLCRAIGCGYGFVDKRGVAAALEVGFS